MKLRDHPLIKDQWPPEWTPYDCSRNPITGEVGILDSIYVSLASSERAVLRIINDGSGYTGAIDFPDAAFCRRFVDLVQPHSGKAISQIGELEISGDLLSLKNSSRPVFCV